MFRKSVVLLAFLAGTGFAAEDTRQLVKMPPAAEANLREEMRANLLNLNEIISLTVAGKLKEAGELAEKVLGKTAMGKNRSLPVDARPGTNMPPAMHELGLEGHKTASAFATIAATGDREKALAALPTVSGSCVGCHYSYRIR
jgi:hypothetical protein